jgi:hypothetical protein
MAAQGAGAILGDVRAHFRQVEPSREMVAMSEDDAGADFGILAEFFVRRGERRNRRQIEGVSLLGAIDTDEKNVVVSLYRDAVAHGAGVWAAPAPGVNAVVRGSRWFWLSGVRGDGCGAFAVDAPALLSAIEPK